MGSLLFVPYRTPEATLYADNKKKAGFSNVDGNTDTIILKSANFLMDNKKTIVFGVLIVVGIVVVIKMSKKK